MFHKSNFGMFDHYLIAVCDLDGYVPELGDNFDDFNFVFHEFEDDAERREWWGDFVRRAAQKTAEAEAGLADWRRRNN